MAIVDAGERMEGRPEGGGTPTSGGPGDLLSRLWPRPDFAAEARAGRSTPERAALFEAIHRNLAFRPAAVEIEGRPGSWPPLWRASVRALRAIWEAGSPSTPAEIRSAYDDAVVAASPDAGDAAPLGGGRGRRGGSPGHPLDLHPALAASAAWLPRLGWPGEARLSFERCHAAIRTVEDGASWLQAVEIRGRDLVRIGDGTRHADEASALAELAPLSARLLAEVARDEAIGLGARALGPGGVRVGPVNPRRVGRSTPDDLVRILGMRGVEFGRGIGQRERQAVCDLAFDAAFDLCHVLRAPAAAASLWGRAGIAFGSRGLGPGVMGHFEPAAFVVHMDGWTGAGVLAHEWGHALDCALGAAAGMGRGSYLSEGAAAGLRDDVLAAMMGEVVDASRRLPDGGETAFLADSRARERGRPYWSTPVEMFARAFECWVHDALEARGRRNDFLVSREAGETLAGREWRAVAHVYPKGRERRRVVGRMDAFLRMAIPTAESRFRRAAAGG